MARRRIIDASSERARDSAVATWRDRAAHTRYREMITRDLGAPTFGPADSCDDGRPVGLAALLLRPSGLFLIALVCFGTVLTAKLWRDGRFDPLFAPKSAKVEPGRKGWMLGDKLPPPPIDRSAVTDPVYADPPKAATKAPKDDETGTE